MKSIASTVEVNFVFDKGIRWMPWRVEAMKDVLGCDKPWGAVKRF